MSKIQVGAKVRVVSGGRYLGKEGIVKSVLMDSAIITGSFPRSRNKIEQEFLTSHLNVLELPAGVVEMTAGANIAQGQAVYANPNGHAVPSGGQHTRSTPLPTKADDAELAALEGDDRADPISAGPGVVSAAAQSLPASTAAAPHLNASSTDVTTPPPAGSLNARLAVRAAEQVVRNADTSPHLIVKALAGCGKSTSMIQGVRHMKDDWKCKCGGKAGFDKVTLAPKCRWCSNGTGNVRHLVPSDQQRAIWDAMALSPKTATICMVAFNRVIAKELEERVPEGVKASTMHSLGFSTVLKNYGRVGVNEHRCRNIILELAGRYPDDLRRSEDDLMRRNRLLIKATEELVGMCKMNMVDPEDQETIISIASYYEIEGVNAEVLELVPRVVQRALDVRRDMTVDYNDQIWLPAVQNLTFVQYDVLIGDETQDWNKCQQTLAKKAGRRIIMVGDRNQSIYAWMGADANSMDRMEQELSASDRGCIILPLTQTRRCGKTIVEECRKIVPEFEAHESNPEGLISHALYPSKEVPVEKSFMASVKDGDMILCRCNAPLVSTCFRFLKIGRKAQIQGRNIGQGLISTIKKLNASSIQDLSGKLDDWSNREIAKERAKQNPNENKIINITDRVDCLRMFMQDQPTVQAVIGRIEAIFTDNKDNPGIKLSSIHRAKGTEADRVFLLQLKGASVPHPMAKSDWAKEGERCCLYVALSRAIHELTYVTGGD